MSDKDDTIKDNIDEIREKAKVIADATGRDVESVVEDLLDDGIVNLSNEKKTDKDLVTQLKEAAELITTVQSINQQVTENTVLNGGDNKTEVKVETTLEGDVVDRAIDSLQRKADNLKKLGLTLVPIFLLITGGSMEAFGVIDIWESDDADDDYEDYEQVWGCTAWDAENYNPDATDDDGSCWWDNGGGGGGGPPCNWIWDDTSYTNDNMPDSLYVRVSFSSFQCEHELEGDFEIHLIRDGEHYDMEEEFQAKFFENYDLEFQFDDLSSGTYTIHASFESYDGSDWHWDSPRDYRFEESCEPNWIWSNEAIYDLDNDGQGFNNDLKVQVRFMDDNKCDIHMNDGYFYINIDGYDSRTIDNNFHDEYFVDETFMNLPEGSYYVEIGYYTNDGSSWGGPNAWVNMEAEEEKQCEINLYEIQLGTNDTHAVVAYDLDCGYGEEVGGYNVSIQFMVIGNESYEIGYQYNTTVHYISGYVQDIHTLTLSNFTHANLTHYDFSWFAIWGDEENPNYIERHWYNLPFTHPEPEPEPESCENLTLTSYGLTLSNQSNDLVLDWDLRHDGANDTNCFVEVEVMITLYQNGTYYDVADFGSNGIHKVYANSSLILDKSFIDIFSNLTAGEYEILAKYRIVGDTNASPDHFANKVTVE